MAKFDADFSIFGTLAGDIKNSVPIENTVIDYANKACVDLYGDLKGRRIGELFEEITGESFSM